MRRPSYIYLPQVTDNRAWRTNAAAEELTRTTGLPNPTKFTMCGWFMFIGDAQTLFQTVMELHGATSASTIYVQTDANGDIGPDGVLGIFRATGGGAPSTNFVSMGTVPTENAWHFIAVVGNGASATGYVFGANEFTGSATYTSGVATTANAAYTAIGMRFGESIFGGEDFNGRSFNIKVWDALLSVPELRFEMQQRVPYRTISLNSWYPVGPSNALAGVDYSGFRRNLTTPAGVTIEDGPPIPWQRFFNRPTPTVKKINAASTYPGYYSSRGMWF